MDYLEFGTNLQCARFDEWVGREYARDLNAAYPVPPDQWIGPPATPPPEAYTYYYDRCKPKVGDGGVYVLDSEVERFATQQQTLSDGSTYVANIAAIKKTFAQLSAAGQAAVTPAPPP